ncbi:MAG TPA: MlaE family lipid ABC transporter permease subunit [Polyangiaceae bacterium]|nr:MlaE family lipid ABC transporter permease subunit [Polyangiaceae bacterium]
MTATRASDGDDRPPVHLALRGRYTLAELPALWDQLRRAALPLRRGDRMRVDLSGVDQADGAAVAVLEHARRQLERRGVTLDLTSPRHEVAELIRIYSGAEPDTPAASRRGESGLLWRIGRGAAELARETGRWFGFAARVCLALAGIARDPATANWRDIPGLMEKAGADAVPIVAIIDFLIGVVTAYEAALQLRRFGATLYVADLVGASVVRELGPLITAVVVTGRTGAAFAAELGTMSVSEEVDALRAMGVDPLRYLVFPRLVTLVAMVPLLTLLGDCVGLLGGLLLAGTTLAITPPEYMAETKTIVFASDIFWGVLKSIAFSIAIGLIACQQGLSASGGASGVGRRTTSAVVSILFTLILLDALFAPFFHGHYR